MRASIGSNEGSIYLQNANTSKTRKKKAGSSLKNKGDGGYYEEFEGNLSIAPIRHTKQSE